MLTMERTLKVRIYCGSDFKVGAALFKREVSICGGDGRNVEPKARLKFEDLDKTIQELRAMYKAHPEWFEVPKPKSDKGQNAVDYYV